MSLIVSGSSGTITERNDVLHSIRSGRSILITVVLLAQKTMMSRLY